MSDSLRSHESQQARPPCPSSTPRVYSNSHPLSRWCHPTISPSVVPFSSCPQSFPASGSFQSWTISNPKRWCCEIAALNMPDNLENLAVATGLKKISFHSNLIEGQGQRMFKLLCTSVLSSHTCWSLALRILSITLIACEMSAIVWLFEHSLALPFYGNGMKTEKDWKTQQWPQDWKRSVFIPIQRKAMTKNSHKGSL